MAVATIDLTARLAKTLPPPKGWLPWAKLDKAPSLRPHIPFQVQHSKMFVPRHCIKSRGVNAQWENRNCPDCHGQYHYFQNNNPRNQQISAYNPFQYRKFTITIKTKTRIIYYKSTNVQRKQFVSRKQSKAPVKVIIKKQ